MSYVIHVGLVEDLKKNKKNPKTPFWKPQEGNWSQCNLPDIVLLKNIRRFVNFFLYQTWTALAPTHWLMQKVYDKEVVTHILTAVFTEIVFEVKI